MDLVGAEHLISLAVLGEGCTCVATHSPVAYVPHRHHIRPRSWGGPDAADNLIVLCPNTHTATHRLLDEYVRHGGDPGWEVRRQFGFLARALALRAWNERPSERPPLTSLSLVAS
jgi:hypothetical protein